MNVVTMHTDRVCFQYQTEKKVGLTKITMHYNNMLEYQKKDEV